MGQVCKDVRPVFIRGTIFSASRRYIKISSFVPSLPTYNFSSVTLLACHILLIVKRQYLIYVIFMGLFLCLFMSHHQLVIDLALLLMREIISCEKKTWDKFILPIKHWKSISALCTIFTLYTNPYDYTSILYRFLFHNFYIWK